MNRIVMLLICSVICVSANAQDITPTPVEAYEIEVVLAGEEIHMPMLREFRESLKESGQSFLILATREPEKQFDRLQVMFVYTEEDTGRVRDIGGRVAQPRRILAVRPTQFTHEGGERRFSSIEVVDDHQVRWYIRFFTLPGLTDLIRNGNDLFPRPHTTETPPTWEELFSNGEVIFYGERGEDADKQYFSTEPMNSCDSHRMRTRPYHQGENHGYELVLDQ